MTPDPRPPGVEQIGGVPQTRIDGSEQPLFPQPINPSGNPPISKEQMTARGDKTRFLIDGDRNRPVTVWHGSRTTGGQIIVRPDGWANSTSRPRAIRNATPDGYAQGSVFTAAASNFKWPRSRLTLAD